MQQGFEVLGKCWLLKSHGWLLYTQSLFLLLDWTASVQNQVAWSMETGTSPSDTFRKPQGTSWQFCFYRKLSHCSPFRQYYLFPLMHTTPTRAIDHTREASSQGQTRGTAQAPVSAWHLLRWPSGRVPKLRQYLMLFYL